jgi:hypothetical protein
MALLEVDARGSIVAGACGSDPDWDEQGGRIFIRSCLIQALGIFPAPQLDYRGYSPAYEEHILARSLDELSR